MVVFFCSTHCCCCCYQSIISSNDFPQLNFLYFQEFIGNLSRSIQKELSYKFHQRLFQKSMQQIACSIFSQFPSQRCNWGTYIFYYNLSGIFCVNRQDSIQNKNRVLIRNLIFWRIFGTIFFIYVKLYNTSKSLCLLNPIHPNLSQEIFKFSRVSSNAFSLKISKNIIPAVLLIVSSEIIIEIRETDSEWVLVVILKYIS